MTTRFLPAVLALLPLATSLSAQQVSNLTGTWKLNVEKSRWGNMRKPVSGMIRIEHNEPALKYTGTLVDAEQNTRTFDFDGAIDGKEYAVRRAYGDGHLAVRRINTRTTASVFRSNDGSYEQTATTTVSRDGGVLTRKLSRKGSEGDAAWTEVYDKR